MLDKYLREKINNNIYNITKYTLNNNQRYNIIKQ